MKQYKKAFEKWFDEYFCDQQGEDSPYQYIDVLEAFKVGVSSTQANPKKDSSPNEDF